MPDLSISPGEYTNWLTDLKQRIQSAQQRAVLSVNRELVLLYTPAISSRKMDISL